jgi:EmrB/QacA subfamily drug resistance transporter
VNESALRKQYEPPPLPFIAKSRAYPWFAVGTVCIGAFMGQLDASIAQLVLPTLQHTFHVSLAMVSWVALSYLLVLASTLPIFGRLADMFGRKLLYTGGFIAFIAGSALCGFADSLPMLIGARALQALGAGLLQANSIAIISVAAGPSRRGRAIGVQGAAQAIGLSLGPALGGLLIQTLGWQWVFWINVPFGIAGTLLGWFVLPQTEDVHRTNRAFDWLGAALLIPALSLVTLALSEMANWGATSLLFLGTLAGGALVTLFFVLHERRASVPIVELDLFRIRAFSAGNAAGLISYGLMFGVFLVLPFALERGYGDAPFSAGLRLATVPIALGLAAPFAGALSDRRGPRPLTVGGMLVAAAALATMAFAVQRLDLGLGLLTVAMTVFGLGQGLFTAPNNSAIMGAAPPGHLGAAGGVLNVMRTLGTSLGVAVASVLLDYRIVAYTGSPSPILSGSRDVLVVFALFAFAAAAISALRGSARGLRGVPVAE